MDFTRRDQIWISAAKEAFKAQQMVKEAEKAKDEAFRVLKDLTQETPSKGGGFVYNYNVRKGTIDYEKIVNTLLDLKANELESFRKSESKAWKLEIQLIEE